jgi:sugar lactone lactonase YvrE
MHDTLLVYDREGRLLMPLAGTEQDMGRFYLPSGVWVDRGSRVFVADMFNGRVAVFQFLGGN